MNDQDQKKLSDAFDMQDLPEKEQEDLLLEVGDVVLKGTVLRLIERMDDATRVEFDALLTKKPVDEEVIQFLTERVEGADQVVEEVLAGLRDDILSGTGT